MSHRARSFPPGHEITQEELDEVRREGEERQRLKPTGEHFSNVTAVMMEFMSASELRAAADKLDTMGEDEPVRVFYGQLAAMMRKAADQPERRQYSSLHT